MKRYSRILHIRYDNRDNEWGGSEKSEVPANRPPHGDGEKAELFGHVCRMNNSQLIKQVVYI